MNALRKLSTGQRAALAYAALVAATAVTEIITGAGPGVRAVTVGVLALIPAGGLTLRLIGPAKGEHATPRRYIRDQWPAPAVIESVVVEGRPPWEDEPPDAYFIAVATRSGGQVTEVRTAVLPPLPPSPDWTPRPALPASSVLERAAKLLPPGFDPDVDSMVDGIQPVRDGAL